MSTICINSLLVRGQAKEIRVFEDLIRRCRARDPESPVIRAALTWPSSDIVETNGTDSDPPLLYCAIENKEADGTEALQIVLLQFPTATSRARMHRKVEFLSARFPLIEFRLAWLCLHDDGQARLRFGHGEAVFRGRPGPELSLSRPASPKLVAPARKRSPRPR